MMICTTKLCVILGFLLAGCSNATDEEPDHSTPVSGLTFNHAQSFQEGQAVVGRNEKYGFIDKSGAWVWRGTQIKYR